jgi:Protein of unknown function (DUF2817)
MATSDFFADTYIAAREKFLSAARAARCDLSKYPLRNHTGPYGEELTIDVGKLGPAEPQALLVLISGTHGVEGFCGSGCQVGFLTDRLYEALPANCGALLVHALNPYGFAWLRRVNEDNIDLNRNFHDFSKDLPSCSAYEELHDWLVPLEWEGEHRQRADEELRRYIAANGERAFQAAVTSGQHTRPTGLFYSGTTKSWSNNTLREICQKYVPATAKMVAVLDFHTGLGPTGYGEPIFVGNDAGFDRAKSWYGPEVKKLDEGGAVAAMVSGDVSNAFRVSLDKTESVYVALEYGTKPVWEVLTALRADHWLHSMPKRPTELRGDIKRNLRDAFYADRSDWKAAVYGRAADFIFRAARGLADLADSSR